jgi:hypothetical protein
MEWIGGGFVLTVGGVRLRVRVALEDTPEPCRPASDARDGAACDTPASPRARERRPDNASSMN